MSHMIRFARPATHSHDMPSCRILSRSEVRLRIHEIPVDSEEYIQLECALIRRIGIVTIELGTLSYKVNTLSEHESLMGGFGSSEHVAIGESVRLPGLPTQTPLLIKGVTSVYFRHIIALAGDYYAIVGEPISLLGGSVEEKTERFKKTFNTLESADNDQLRRVLLELEGECTAVKHSSLPHHCYSNQMMEINKAIKKIKGDIEELLIDNSDHFSNNAKEAYQVGHALALKEAKAAGQRKDIEGLKRAYAIEAFACHFLTDLFASGHIRNQRGDLEILLGTKLGFNSVLAKKCAGLLTGAQHEKDGLEGLNVANLKGDMWRAYGDSHFFGPQNAANRGQVITTTQSSVEEVFQAYTHPERQVHSVIDQLIPFATDLNPSPLYSVENGALFLFEGSEKVEITSQSDYFSRGIPLALRYLPENYISGFIAPEVKMNPLLDKVIVPQIQRLTGSIWALAGIATFRQLQQGNRELNEKIEEMSHTVKDLHQNSASILEQMRKFNFKINQVLWNQLFDEASRSIGVIKDVVHEQHQYKDMLKPEQLERAEKRLWNAHITLSRVLSEGTAHEQSLLAAHEIFLKSKQMDSVDIKLSLTFWLRQMLDYQVQAMRLYTALRALNGEDAQEIQRVIANFEKTLLNQIEANKQFIDPMLIDQNQGYIKLQIQKRKTTELKLLNNSN